MLLKDKVAVLVRFHDAAQLEALGLALFGLENQIYPNIEPIVITQRFSPDQIAAVTDVLESYRWSNQVRPRVINVDQETPQDLRCVLLNTGIKESADARYLAIHDFDDFCGQNHYSRLVERLEKSSVGIAFSGFVNIEQIPTEYYNSTVHKRFISRPDFRLQKLVDNPHFLIHAAVVDRSRVLDDDLWFDESIVYEEDYNFQLRIAMRYGADFEAANEKLPAAIRTIRRDGSNSIVTDFDDPEAREQKISRRLEGKRANTAVRNAFRRDEFDPFVLYWNEPLPIRGGRAYDWALYAFGVGFAAHPRRNGYGHLRAIHSNRYDTLSGSFADANWRFRTNPELTRQLEALFGEDLAWDKEAIQIWTDLQKGHGAAYQIERDILVKAQDTFPFQTIITLGPNGAVKDHVKEHGLNHVQIELGPTRNPYLETAHCDPFGVNGSALTWRLPEVFALPELPAEKWMDGFIGRVGIQSPKTPPALAEAKATGRKVAVIPLQLSDDSNFLLYADRYNTFADFLADVVPPLIAAGWTCLIRPHPFSDRLEVNKIDHDACQAWFEALGSEHAVWYDNALSTSEKIGLLAYADAMVSVNSSIAFEAILHGTPTVLTGKASFALPSWLPSLDDLISGIDRTAWAERLRRIAAFNLFHQFVPVGDLFHPPNLMRRLDEAYAIQDAYDAGGAEALAKHVLAAPRTRLVDYFTMGRNPMAAAAPRTMMNMRVIKNTTLLDPL